MKTFLFSAAIALSSAAGAAPSNTIATEGMTPPKVKSFLEGGYRVAVTCFGKGEQISGMNKICYYDCLGSLTAITISAVSLCPLTINN